MPRRRPARLERDGGIPFRGEDDCLRAHHGTERSRLAHSVLSTHATAAPCPLPTQGRQCQSSSSRRSSVSVVLVPSVPAAFRRLIVATPASSSDRAPNTLQNSTGPPRRSFHPPRPHHRRREEQDSAPPPRRAVVVSPARADRTPFLRRQGKAYKDR